MTGQRMGQIKAVLTVLGLAGMIVMLPSCATHYDLTLGNNDVIRARTKPVLNEQGQYVFEDLSGRPVMVNKMRVRQIEAVRRGSKPSNPF
jgi:hypothetical protein